MIRKFIAFAFLTLFLASCGGKEESNTTSPTDTVAESSSAAPESAPVSSNYDLIIKNGMVYLLGRASANTIETTKKELWANTQNTVASAIR